MTATKKPKKIRQPQAFWVRAVHAPQAMQIKITLLDVTPPVWRRFLIPNEFTVADLRLAVQIVMGWQDSHLDQFTIGRDRYDVQQFEMSPDFEGESAKDGRTAVLAYTLPQPGTSFLYTYDFGDSWEHELVVEKLLPIEPGKAYPRCLEGARACPPEDTGGSWGYAELLEILADPKHPEYEERLEWLGEKFDPEKFSIRAVNGQLNRRFKPYHVRKAKKL